MAAQTASTVRAAAFRSRCLSLAKTCSIGFRSGEYFGRKNSLAPAERMSWRTALLLWLPRLSRTTISPGRRVDGPRRIDPVMAQGRQEGHGFPAAVRNLGAESVPARSPSPQGRHVCPGPGLVDEDKPLSFDPILILCPLNAPPRHVGTIAFASRHAFF